MPLEIGFAIQAFAQTLAERPSSPLIFGSDLPGYGLVGECDLIEDPCRLVANVQHNAPQTTIAFGNAVVARLVGVSTGTGDQSQRSPDDPDDIADPN